MKAWSVMDGSGEIKLDASKNALNGRVRLGKSGKDGLGRAGIYLNLANSDGSPTDLSKESDGLCIAYQSDFDMEVRLDADDDKVVSVENVLPYVNMKITESDPETRCASWDEFKADKASGIDGQDAARNVHSVQLVFFGKSDASGEFSIRRLTRYVRSDMWIGKDGNDRVETGFNEGEKGSSGELSVFGDFSEAYIEWDGNTYGDDTTFSDVIYNNEGLSGYVIFEGSASSPDVGIQFLVAGKSTEDGEDHVYSADVSESWTGLCLRYESDMDIVMELITDEKTAKKLEEDRITAMFPKNKNEETSCVEFEDLLEKSDDKKASEILKNLAVVRLKFEKNNKSGTYFWIGTISCLLPEDRSVKDYGDYKDVKPTTSSKYKSGKSFLWNGSVDGDRVELGIENATEGGIWIISPEETDNYSFGFPDDVVADEDGYVISSLVKKYHSFQFYVKSYEDEYDFANISFNTVSSKKEQADISAWGGFCIHYKTYSSVRIALLSDSLAKNYWYADVDYSDDMVWGMVSWDAFENTDKESNEKIEDVIGSVSTVRLQFLYDGETVIDKFGSYDQ